MCELVFSLSKWRAGKVRWMWADVGHLGRDGPSFARFNPVRWSAWADIETIIRELSEVEVSEGSGSRPVNLHVAKHGFVEKFENAAQAVQFLEELEADSPSGSDSAIGGPAKIPRGPVPSEIREVISGCVFDFMEAEYILGASEFPDYRKARRAGHLHRFTVKLKDVIRNADAESVLVVSHRWVNHDHPDPDGEQLRAVQHFLQNHRNFRLVWIDWCCLPQGHRNQQEDEFFQGCLSYANLLYLRFFVLIIADSAYMSRFWTQFECLLAMRIIHEDGLVPAIDVGGKVRHKITVTGIDKDEPRQIVRALSRRWSTCSMPQALTKLSARDVQVTNGKDKTLQLQKLSELHNWMARLWVHSMQ